MDDVNCLLYTREEVVRMCTCYIITWWGRGCTPKPASNYDCGAMFNLVLSSGGYMKEIEHWCFIMSRIVGLF
jgi:hypothetical protein